MRLKLFASFEDNLVY